MKERDDIIKQLEKEKDEFMKVTLTDVEKCHEVYQSKIDKLETEKQNMINQISLQVNRLRDYEHDDIFEYKQQLTDLRKHIEAKDEIIKIKDMESCNSSN